MNDREKLARLTALLSSGLSLQEAERSSSVDGIKGDLGRQYRLVRELCLTCGAAPTLAMRQLQSLAIDRAAGEAKLRLAAATPRATARLVQWLPVAALMLGQLVGLGSIEILFSSGLAIVSCVIGFAFLLLANILSTRMIAKANEAREDYTIALDAFAMCLSAGLPLSLARDNLERVFERVYEQELPADAVHEIEQLAKLSSISGAPIERMLRARAAEMRFNLHQERLSKLERLSVRLLVPLAVFVLPAFVFISVIPISISLLSKK